MSAEEIKLFFDKIDQGILMKRSGSAKYARGYNLFKAGAVKKISLEGRTTFKAGVLGSRPYDVRIELSASPPEFYCTCPSDPDQLCKHSVAAGLKILDDPDSVEIIGKPEHDSEDDEEIQAILKNTPDEQKDAFLMEIFQMDNSLMERFLIKTRGQLAVVSNIDVRSIGQVVAEKLDNLCFNDFELLHYYGNKDPNSYHSGYRDEWEIYESGANYMIREVLNPYKNRIAADLKIGNIIESSKNFLGILSGVMMVKGDQIDDEYNIFCENYKYHLLFFVREIFDDFFKVFRTCEKSEAALRVISESLFKELGDLKEKNLYEVEDCDLSFLKTLILELIQTAKLADDVLDQLGRIELSEGDRDEIRMIIAEIKQNGVQWLKIARRAYLRNDEIGKQLLNYYQDKNDPEQFLLFAQKLFNKSPHSFSEFLYEKPLIKKDEELYIKILETLTWNRASLHHFREFKKIADPERVAAFFKRFDRYNRNQFWVELMVEEKEFENILDHIKKNPNPYQFNIFMPPILNIFPESCYKICKKATNKFLKDSVGRKYYASAAHWLKLIKKIRDKKIRKNAADYIESLLLTYKNRPAMRDEFINAGLLK